MLDWSSLTHAYGKASDIPALLANLSPGAEFDVWDELWSRLCHQGSVYSASFAALPVLADLGERWPPRERSQLIALAASILASRDVWGACPPDLRAAVELLVPRFRRLCDEALAETGLARHEFIQLLQASRALAGDRFWGEKLDHLASGEFPGACPSCDVDLYFVVGEYGIFTTAEEWVVRTGKPGPIIVRTDITRVPIVPKDGALPEVGQWLYERAQAAGQDDVARWIRCLFGTSECPKCGGAFEVVNAIKGPGGQELIK